MSSLCAVHTSAASQARKRRPATDPVSGEAIDIGRLAMRNFRRRRAAGVSAPTENLLAVLAEDGSPLAQKWLAEFQRKQAAGR
jgi:hypothetical protein